ncbi:filamin [Naegleria gruberi]|uniref:Filamin n=1 Tax=Naegleria gruberi TaxID=5762 RepID=D2V143_NAEGR|nr:filamin [Naegleria gruberi]EFC49837.1 filamin [Naegleria gruberi]|eukprot:XP_002682581.1 filamin [Naegleria gruberi]
MVLGEASKKEQQGPRSHKVVDPTANERKDDDIEIQVQAIEARNLVGSIIKKPNPYLGVYVLKESFPRVTTEPQKKTTSPKWNQTLNVYCRNWTKTKQPMNIRCELYDWSKSDDHEHDFLGEVTIRFNDYAALKETTGKWFELWLPLQKRTSKDKVSGDLHISVRCIDLEEKALKKQRKQQAILEQQQPPQPHINTPSSIDPTLENISQNPLKLPLIPPTLPIEEPEEDIEDINVEGRGLRDGLRSGQIGKINFTAKNNKGKNVRVPPDQVEAEWVGPNGNCGVVKARKKTVMDNNDENDENDQLELDFIPTDGPGNYLIEFKVKGKPSKYGPRQVTVHPLPLAREAMAYGDSLYNPEQKTKPYKPNYVNCPGEFYVQAKDENGMDIIEGGDEVTCELEDGTVLDIKDIKDNNNGSYTVPYIPKKSGVFPVKVLFNGEPINNSPVHLLVEFEMDPTRTLVTELSTTVPVDVPQTFSLTTYDTNGDKKLCGGDDVEIVLESEFGDQVMTFISDNDTGKYDVTFVCPVPGKYNFKAKINDSPILADITITAVPRVDPGMCTIFGNELNGGDLYSRNGLPLKFNVQARDQRGVAVKSGGEPILTQVYYRPDKKTQNGIKLEAPDNVLTDNFDGTYSIDFVPEQPGIYTFDLTLNDQALQFSPHPMIVSDGIEPSNTIAYGPGLVKGFVDTPAIFYVEARDHNDNRVQDPNLSFDVTVHDSNGDEVNVKPLPVEENGVYPYLYTPTNVGVHNVNIAHKGKPIKDSPYQVPVTDSQYAPDPTRCEMGPVSKTGFVHKPITFDVKLRTKDGKPVRVPGATDVTVNVTPEDPTLDRYPPQKVKITEKPNGVHEVEWTPLVPGKYNIDVKVNRAPVRNSPARGINILPPGGLLAKLTERSFQIQLFDDQGNKYTDPDEEELESVKVTFVEEETNALTEEIKYNINYVGEGLFQIKYLIQKPGNYIISMYVEGALVGQTKVQSENFEYEQDAE